MAVTVTENAGTFQKGLSEWWSEETEYVFQRIERWAAFARGYNRLRSQKLSRSRLTMQDGQEREPRWISSGKLTDDVSWSPRFHSLKKPRRKSRPEEAKINCCGTFSYQSNGNLDSTCLEEYRYDHSIYFKTIGDIRSYKKTNDNDERVSISSEELVEWESSSLRESIDFFDEEAISETNNAETDRINGVWPIVDLATLDLNSEACWNDNRTEENNNYIEGNAVEKEARETPKIQEDVKRFHSFRKNRRLSRTVRQPPIIGDNNVVWPGVLLSYANPSLSSHCSAK